MSPRSAGWLASARSQRGFTLTELLVALTVTVIGLAGLLSLHVTTVKGNAIAGRAAEAVLAAEQTIETLRRERVVDLETAYGAITIAELGPVDLSLTLGPIVGRSGLPYAGVLYHQQHAAEPSLVRFRIVIYWMDEGALMPAISDLETDADHRLEVQFVRTRVELL